jgi:hypothetical protein
VAPLVQTANPDMVLIIKTVNKQLPLVNLPKWIEQHVAGVQQLDPLSFAPKPPAPKPPEAKQQGTWKIPDES